MFNIRQEWHLSEIKFIDMKMEASEKIKRPQELVSNFQIVNVQQNFTKKKEFAHPRPGVARLFCLRAKFH